MNSLCFLSILITASTGLPGSSYPRLYAIDINDMNGLHIFRKLQDRHCPIYRKIEQYDTKLLFSDGEWKIMDKLTSYSGSEGNCLAKGGQLLGEIINVNS